MGDGTPVFFKLSFHTTEWEGRDFSIIKLLVELELGEAHSFSIFGDLRHEEAEGEESMTMEVESCSVLVRWFSVFSLSIGGFSTFSPFSPFSRDFTE